MRTSIKTFENSLREYLISIESDSYNTQTKMGYKYNNLKVYMEPDKISTPHFCVSVSISYARYSLEPLRKIEGSMGEEEVYILRWASRSNILGELKKYWEFLTKTKGNFEEIENNENMSIAILSNEEIEEVGDTITGAGIRKIDTKIKKQEITNENIE